MSREWKPGDIAAFDAAGGERVTLIRTSEGKWTGYAPGSHRSWIDRPWRDGQHGLRPLVVLDLSDTPAATDPAARTEAHHLIDMLREMAENFFVPDAADLARKVADQIEEQVGPKSPPKPDEPAGLGAVVEAIYDNHFVHIGGGLWQRVDDGTDEPCEYPEIAVVRVLSEGVPC